MPDETFSDDRLVRFALGDVPDGERDAIDAHVAASSAATAFVDRVRSVIEIMSADEAEAPSAAAVRRAVALWAPPERIGVADVARALRRVAAVLVFDSRAQPALAGFRGADADYQLAFESEPAQIDVRVARVEAVAPERWRVRGQVTLRGSGSVSAVRLVPTGSTEAVPGANADDDGTFRIDAAPGAYDLVVETDGAAVVAGLALG